MSATPGTSHTLFARLLAVLGSLVVALEIARLWAPVVEADHRTLPGLRLVREALTGYEPVRAWFTGNAVLAASLGLVALVLALLTYRAAIVFWRNHVIARLSGTYFKPDNGRFPNHPVDLMQEVERRPPGTTFVGMTPRRTLFGWRWTPVYVSERQRTTHRHVLGKTGCNRSRDRQGIWSVIYTPGACRS